MSYTPAIDISQYQGDWQNYSEPIVIIKVSGGDAGLYYDSKATQNYYAAKNAGKAVGMYHFAGGTDPTAEAHHFIRACSPLAEADVLILDWEVHHPNPVEWCRQFVNTIKTETTVTPIIYMNTSTENAFDWSPVINQNVGLWVADYRYTPDQNVPIRHWSTYIMHQYTSTPVDRDAWFGTVEQFKAYGFHAPVTVPEPTPEPPVDPPVEVPPVDPPVVVPPIVVSDPEPPYPSWFVRFLKAVITFLKKEI